MGPERLEFCKAPGGSGALRRQARDFFFYSELLSFEFGDMHGVGKGPVDLVVDFVFEARVPRPKSLDTVFRRHRQFSLSWSGNRPKHKKSYARP
jgi:hypothetical protein